MQRCAWCLGLLLGLGCGSNDQPPPATKADAGTPTPDAGPPAPEFTIRLEIADGLGSDALLGAPLDLVLAPSGQPAVVYGSTPVGTTEQVIRYAERQGEDNWAVEDALRPGSQAPNQGELLALSAAVFDGAVNIAFLGGDDDGNVLTPFPTDLMLATRGSAGWTEQTLVDTSGEAAGECPDLQNYCNTGHVVGSHAALATQGSGYAVLYRDTHIGFGDDDLRRSDVELFGGGSAELLDPERGGGAWGALAFLPDGRRAAAYLVESDFAGSDARGIWTWVEGSEAPVKVSDGVTSHRMTLAAGADGHLWLGWFDLGEQDLKVADAAAPYDAWTVTKVDSSGSVGLHPDLAIDADGTPRVVYGYCGRATDRDCPGSPGARSEVRMAWYAGGMWTQTLITDGEGRGGVGFYNRIVALADGWAVATQDVDQSDVLVALVKVTP